MLYTFLRDSLRFFAQNWLPLTLISVGLGIVFESLVAVVQQPYTDDQFPVEAYIIQWLGGVWTSAALILYVSEALGERYLSPRNAITGALPWLLPLAAVQFLSGLAIGLGMLLLIVPGIYFAVRLALSGFYLILDRQPIIEALRQSWIQSSGYGWTLFGGYALIYGALILGMQALAVLLGIGTESYSLGNAVLGVLFKPVSALALVFGFRVFTDAQNSRKART